jgi:hypothetical protein
MKIMDMKALAKKPLTATLTVGVIEEELNQDEFLVSIGDLPVRASVAVSCMISPIVGDEVAFLGGDEGVAFITSVLSREESADLTIRSVRKISIHSENELKLSSSSDITVASQQNLSWSGDTSSLTARAFRVYIDELDGVVRRLSFAGDHMESCFKNINSTIETLVQNAKSVFRNTKDLENIRCGSMTTKVEGFSVTQCRNGAITAEDDFRIDGERVHVG